MTAAVRVSLLFEYPTLNGGERSLLAVLPRLISAGIEPTAIAPPSGPLADAIGEAGLPLVPLELRDPRTNRRGPLEESAERLAAVLAEVPAGLVHANSLSLSRLLGHVRGGFAWRATGHCRDIVGLSAAAVRDVARLDRVVAVSAAVADHLAELGVDRPRVAVVHNGIAANFLARSGERFRLRKEYGIPQADRLLLGVGQRVRRKGWDVLADALAGMDRQGVWFALIGDCTSGKEEARRFDDEIERRFRDLFGDRFLSLGRRGDVPGWMQAADLLVHPARQEPFGRVLLEAGLSRLPIVATDVGGTAELVGDSGTRLVPAGDAAALRSAIADFLADPAGFAAAAARLGERVRESFPVERAASGLLAVWRQSLSPP